MKVKIHSIGLNPKESLEGHLEKKVSKLEVFHDGIVACDIFLKVENSSKENKTVELILNVPGDEIVVKRTCFSFEESIDTCIDIAKKLLIKNKETYKSFS